MSELMSTLQSTGMLSNWITNAQAPDLEHHLNNMRGSDNYPVLKRQIERLRSCKVRIENNHPRIR